MKKMKLNFIEDPEIAAAILELKSRWPAIGEAADHPLTEWFIRNRKKLKRDSSAVFTFSRRKKLKKIGRPFCLVADMGDPEQWAHFAMLPLQYRDLAGAIAGYEYFTQIMPGKYHRWSMALGTAILSIGILELGKIMTQDPKRLVPYGFQEEHWSLAVWVLMSLLAGIFSFSFLFLMNTRSLSLTLILSQLNTSYKQNQGGAIGALTGNLLPIPTLGLVASFIVVGVSMDKALIGVPVIYLTVASLVNFGLRYYYSAKDVNTMFLAIVERESAKYPDYVRGIIESK